MVVKMGYEELSSKESTDSAESETLLLGDDALLRPNKDSQLCKWLHWGFHAISTAIIIVLLVLLYSVSQTSRAKCWSMFNYYSPVDEAVVPHPYIHKVFNGSLWNPTRWKGPPTEEVENAWYEIMQYGMISVTKEDIEKVHHPDWSAKFPSEAGGGYIAATIGTHQVHCLHYIWQDHYIDYVPKMQDKKQRVPELYELHYEHCVDYIRQSLMCQFDTGIIPYNWVLDHQNPTPNSNTHHKCVNWDALQEWLKNRAVKMPDNFQWKQPEDAISLGWNP